MADDLSRSSSDEETEGGPGRSYECVFCKRGFTTAQALGGHMNIHRKDRAKPRPNTTKFDEDYYASLRGFPVIQTYPHQIISYHTFLPPAAGWGLQPQIGDGFYAQSPPMVEENLSLQIGPSDRVAARREADELDLELRLGHHHP